MCDCFPYIMSVNYVQSVPLEAHVGLLELELWMVVNHHMAAGNRTLVSARATNALNHRASSPALLFS